MKTAGIIGGIGPESTIDYYRLILSRYRERRPDGAAPSILINSIDIQRIIDAMTAGDFPRVTGYVLPELERLASAGASFGALAANTPHVVFDDLASRCSLPLISIVEETCRSAKSHGFKNVGLFGTRFTMEGSFYPAVFSRRGIRISVPPPDERAYIHEKYMGELVPGQFLAQTRESFVAIARRLFESSGIDGLILGGTELPLLLREDRVAGVPVLDTTRIHVEAIVDALLREDPAAAPAGE
ncbi:MAG: amino acid racemase [Acidobacteriota bacterium]